MKRFFGVPLCRFIQCRVLHGGAVEDVSTSSPLTSSDTTSTTTTLTTTPINTTSSTTTDNSDASPPAHLTQRVADSVLRTSGTTPVDVGSVVTSPTRKIIDSALRTDIDTSRTAAKKSTHTPTPDEDSARMLLSQFSRRRRGAKPSRASEDLAVVTAHLKAKRGQIGVATVSAALEVLAVHGLDRTCLGLWEKEVRAKGMTLSPQAYGNLLRVCGVSGNLSGVMKVWGEMKAFGVMPTLSGVHSVARCLVKRGHRGTAFTMLSKTLSIGKVEEVTLAILFSSCQSLEQAGGVVQRVGGSIEPRVLEEFIRIAARLGKPLLVELSLRAAPPGAISESSHFSLLLLAYVQAGDMLSAQMVVSRMRMRCISLTAIDITLFLRGTAQHIEREGKDVRAVSRAEDLFHAFFAEPKGGGGGGSEPKAAGPADRQTRMLTAMMKVYIASKDRLSALALYRWMQQRNVVMTEPLMQQVSLALTCGL